MKHLFSKPIAAILAIALFFAACDISGSNSNAVKDQKVAVKMKVRTTSPKAKMTNGFMQANESLRLKEVKMLVEELELESALDQDSLDFEVDDLIVNLPLDGSEFTLTSEVVPEGIYDEFEMEIDQPDQNSVNDPDFYNDSGDENYSIVIKGTYKSKDFVFLSKEEFELELELNPPLEVIDSRTPSVAISVDPFNWFKDEAGNPLDPTDPANYEQINNNIAKSFGAERDDDNENDSEDDGKNDDD